jgi:signal transduction histidine kinase
MGVQDSSKKAAILVVDDMADNLALLSNLLKDEYRVKIANSGEKALRIALADPQPELILLDVMMPGMDGYEVCWSLKHNTRTMNIPVIFLTGKTEDEDEKKGLELGAVDYITKPISPPIVMARVKNHLALKGLADFLQNQNVELGNAKLAAEKANLAKSDFLSSMSHELRSPLNAILGFAQLMETDSTPPNPSQKESISQIIKAGWHLLNLINEILDLAKVESRQIPLLQEPVLLANVLHECREMLDHQAQQRGIAMVFPPTDLPYFVLADRTRVKQVLINLLSNAIKYNFEYGTVEVSCLESKLGRIRLSIRDTGAGLLPEHQEQLFQAFNRLGQESGGVEGTGIGLVVAKRLVELMGGEIGVDSTVGKGSIFWFELLAVAAPTNSTNEPDTLELPGTQTRRKERMDTVLYVEDNQANQILVEKLIARYPGIRLLTAMNGNRGIEIARESHPDVILMDINLAGIDGYEALKILRADPETAQIPVIAISGNAMPHDIEKGLAAGFAAYYTKPIKVDEFMGALNEALDLVAHKPADHLMNQVEG